VLKCPICGVEYKGIDTESGGPWFPPCPNGHTYWEQIAYADEQLQKRVKEVK